MNEIRLTQIIDSMWQWFSTSKGRPGIKDTTKIYSAKYDCFLDSSVSDPISFSVFELSEKGELLIHDVSKLMESKSCYFLFINTDKKFVVMVKNTLENCKKLMQGEKIDNIKVKIIT